jgi:hypothetical protein
MCTSVATKGGLSTASCQLLELMQHINFGRIQKLVIHDGEPVLHPRPVIVCEIKLAGENGPRSELGSTDFLLKPQVVELFGYFNEMQSGVVDVLDIKHGLPFRMTVTEISA